MQQQAILTLLKKPHERHTQELKQLYFWLESMPFFKNQNCQEPELLKLTSCLGIHYARKGKTLFDIATPGEFFYLVLRGQVTTEVPSAQRQELVQRIEDEKRNREIL